LHRRRRYWQPIWEPPINIVHDLRPALGDVVVVVGLGVVGLLVTWLLARHPLACAWASIPSLRAVNWLRQLADAVCAPADAAAVVTVATHGRGADGVIEVKWQSSGTRRSGGSGRI
jgi:threonine dehydrogenase-like Zn-dependent dehydrogenase